MSIDGIWEEQNGRFLSTAMRWLRIGLSQQSDAEPREESGSADEAVAEMAEIAAGMAPPPALTVLVDAFRLTPFERDLLLLCVAMELDTRIPSLCARAHGDPSRPYPSFGLALALFPGGSWDAISPTRPLRYWRLIEVVQTAGQPLVAGTLRADERIVNFTKGLNELDERLVALFERVPPPGLSVPLPPSTRKTIARAVQALTAGALHGGSQVQLLGDDAESKRLIASHASVQFDLHLHRLPIGSIPEPLGELEMLSRLWRREMRLLPLALYLDADASDAPAPPEVQRVDRFLKPGEGVVFLASREAWPIPGRRNAIVDVSRPTSGEQEEIWREALGPDGGDVSARLASHFDLSLTAIQEILLAVSADPSQLWQACLDATRPRMQALAERLDPRATWTDLVLPSPELKVLHELAEQVRHRSVVYDAWGFRRKTARGLGINALFAGPSGSGKTMAAEVLANDLGLSLYRIDLSTVVDKYIGETEKNLRRLFDAAESGGMILFFDEADALFGKRSEIKDSHDRYANIEINYLLQRMEAYRGLAVLATNLKSALDPAFARRLRCMIDFPFPAAAQRRLIWQRIFPTQAPVGELDLDRLARHNLTGGSIRNVALNAAFLAAAAGTEITMALVLDSIRTELRKLEKPINEADFRDDGPAQGAAA